MRTKQTTILTYLLLVAIGGIMAAQVYMVAAPLVSAVIERVGALLAG